MQRKLRFYLAYLSRPVWDTGIAPPELMDFIATHPPGRALDLGCGTGTNAIILATHGWEVTGVDFARIAVLRGKRKARKLALKVRLLVGDVTHLEGISGPFDLILDIGCFTSLPPHSRQPYIRKNEQLLANNGTFLIYLFYKEFPDDDRPGATEADIHFMMEKFHLAQRMDGTERGIRPSAWLTFQKKLASEPNGVK